MPPEKVTVVLRSNSPLDLFDSSVKGVDPITTTGTEVPASKLDDVKESARNAGVRLSVRGASKDDKND